MRKYVVVDIDGTVADCNWRAEKYLQCEPKNWDAYFKDCIADKPIKPIIELVRELRKHYGIVYCSGRRESMREETEAWMRLYGLDGHKAMLLRPERDHRHDMQIKPEMLEAFCKKDDVAFILEDRNSMVQKWRELGYTCLQVADGDF